MTKKISVPDWDYWATWPQANILSFDQALAKTGWALVSFRNGIAPAVLCGGTLVTEPHPELPDSIASLVRAENIYDMVLNDIPGDVLPFSVDYVVHEAPVVLAKFSVKREGGPLSALAVRLAGRYFDAPIISVNANHAKKMVTGNHNAEKAQMRDAVKAVLGTAKIGFRTNEHIWDAIGLALTAALDIVEGSV